MAQRLAAHRSTTANSLQHKFRVFLVCVTGIFVTVFDTSSAIVALPTIALQFSTDLPTAQWVVIGNSLTIAALLVPLGRLSDAIGRKRIYVLGCCLFSVGAVLAANAAGIHWLIGARVLVGIGSAMTQSTAMALVVGAYGVHERARVLGWQMTGVGLGAIVGPATGGLIVGTIGWRALFAMTALAMILIALAAQLVLERRGHRPHRGEPFDATGALLFSALLIAALLALTLGPRYGWAEPRAIVNYALVAVLGGAFVLAEKRSKTPLLDFALFRVGAFGLGAISSIVAFMGLSATRFLTPFFLQGIQGIDPSRVGLLMMPAAMVTAIAGPLVGRFADKVGIRLFANLGIAIAMLGLLQFYWLDVASPVSLVVTALMTMALGLAVFSAPNSTSMMNAVEARAHGFAAGFVNLCRNTGNVMGIAFGTALVTLTMADAGYAPSLDAVGPRADPGALAAFVGGLQAAAGALLVLTFAVLTVLLVWTWRRRASARESTAGDGRSGRHSSARKPQR